jgi:hypothetical protein
MNAVKKTLSGKISSMGGGSSLKSRSRKHTSDAADPSDVTLLKSDPTLVGGVMLGEAASDAERLHAAHSRIQELERQLASASTPKATPSQVKKTDLTPLAHGANAQTARTFACKSCATNSLSAPVLVAFFTLLRDNPAYAALDLPAGSALREFASRMHLLADVDLDGDLNDAEFELMWKQLPAVKATDVLGERFGAKFVTGLDTFVFGSREDWLGGLPQKLGTLIRRSVEVECTTNDGGRWKQLYEYIVKKSASPMHKAEDGNDAHGEPIVFDEGHKGMKLTDFQRLASERNTPLSLVETGVLRMYTTEFFTPWNNALRGLDLNFKPDGGKGLEQWATCIAVLFSAVIKLSAVPPCKPDSGKPVLRVWRGVKETGMRLPPAFLEPNEQNQGFPGGSEQVRVGVDTHARAHARMHAHTHTHTHAHARAHTRIHAHTRARVAACC